MLKISIYQIYFLFIPNCQNYTVSEDEMWDNLFNG